MTVAAKPSEPAEGSGAPRTAQPRQFIVTVYGLYSRTEGGWLSVGSLINLLADLGIDAPAVRSSISRLKRRGILHAERRGGAAGYALSEEGMAVLREGDHRIFRRERSSLADGWLLAVFSVPESERSKRHLLRSRLNRLGFGTTASGVYIAPAHLHEPTSEVLRRLGLDGYADLFRADHLAFSDLKAKVRQWWDLDQLEQLYTEFVDEHAPVLERWRQRSAVDERDAFIDYVRTLTDWRHLPYLDPGLPHELLPPDWIGIRAADLFFTLQARLEDGARAYVASAIAG
ncbi:PaaX family transcriptional regulator [Wenjunlia tyrosinilytica]|uniref:PaaX family transcriptional regulator n=1 Tax=Wenjunlia tyrosinilytica TaxID=1544741 RepID=A0A917ZUS2_9ACTN|nr:PaaX family transcriptional regulator C-terminal domain-containing protein [Wenjunlia tyrosinilytica]GGO94703.1 PaaX family transcriptional regulator [Wenjunlia tyrosinilytica]